jgi:ketosteroid isomerase-like protein
MKRWILVAVVACLVLPRSAGQTTNEREVESKLLALERLVRVQAFSAKDVATVDAFLADECAFVTLEGRSENKAEFLRDLQSVDMVRYVVQQMIVRVHGDTAVVTGLLQMSGVQHGKSFVRQGRFLDTWVTRNGHWLMLASLSTPWK